jgi:separase
LSYAKEAFHLRTKFLHKKFTYFHKKTCDVHVEAHGSVAIETWPDLSRADATIDSFLSPWIILRCYLESTFQVSYFVLRCSIHLVVLEWLSYFCYSQVGSIYGLIGNGAEAEFMFRTGKIISHLQLLDSFEITFASSLGEYYMITATGHCSQVPLDLLFYCKKE